MKFLLTADIHCSDHPRDSYRFLLFKWLAKQQEIHKTDALFVLGDLVTAKDYHSSILINKIIDGLKMLKPPVFVLRGNHDGIDPTLPYFRFLNHMAGITFCIEPTLFENYKVMMIPHQLNQTALDKALKTVPDGWLGLLHQTLTGAIGDTGNRLTGMAIAPNKARKLYSGDVHFPHVCEGVTYIGSPYHTRHGIDYKARVLLLDNDNETNLYFDAPKKLSLTIRDLSEMPELKKGDQVKVTLELPRSEAVEWANHKKSILDYCKDKGIEVYGTELKVAQARKRQRLDDTLTNRSNLDYFKAFCAAEQVPSNIKSVGLQLVESGGSNG